MKHFIVSLILGLVGVLFFFSAPCPAEISSADVTFSASYEKGYAADTAVGNPEAKPVGIVSSGDGMADKAIIVGEKGWLQYSLKENIRQDDVPGSIELWIKPIDWDGAGTLGAALFHADYDNTGKKDPETGIFQLYSQGNGRLTFIGGPYPKDDVRGQVCAQADIAGWHKGEWHQVIVTWDGVDMAIYIDGEPKARNKINIMSGGEDPRFKPNLGETFTIGGTPEGKMGETAVDEVTIFRRALKPEEVSQRFGRKSSLIQKAAQEPAADTGKPVMLPLPLSAKKPVIDGKIEAGEWDDASSTNIFVTLLAQERKLWPFGNCIQGKVVDKNLYLALSSEFYCGAPPVGEGESHSGKVSRDDGFAILLTAGKSSQIFEIVVNTRGCLDVYRTRPKYELIPTAIRSAASIADESWSTELEIPFSEIIENFSGTLPEKVLLQVARCYKKGTFAEREKQENSLVLDKTEDYVGFPWNLSFLDVRNYAELVLSPEGQVATCNIDIGKFLTQNRVALQVWQGPGAPSAGFMLKAVWSSAVSAMTDEIAPASNGAFNYDKEIPPGSDRVSIGNGRNFNLVIPLTQVPKLVLKNTLFSCNDTMEVTLDIGGMVPPPEGLMADISVRNAEGQTVLGKTLKGIMSGNARATLSIAGLAAGKYVLECTVLADPKKTALVTEKQTFQIFRGLPGAGLFESLLEEVPTPWTPVEVLADHEIGIWGRRYAFGDHFMPRQITALDQPLLAKPVFYEVQLAEGEPFPIDKGVTRILEQKPAGCTMETSTMVQDVSFRQTTRVEYDGMMRFDVEVTSRKPMTRLTLHVPYLPERAEIFQSVYARGNRIPFMIDAVEITPDYVWTSNYLYPALWVADMHGGLSWFAGSDRTWVVDDGREKLKVTKNGIVVHFIDTEKDAPTSIKFTFGLQAFPTKPARADWREFGRVLESNWASVFVPDCDLEKAVDGLVLPDYYTKIMPELWWTRRLRSLLLPFCNFPRSVEEYTELKPEIYKLAVDALHDAMDKAQKGGYEYVVPYLTPTYATMSIPEWKFYWSNWIAIPKHIFDSYGQPCVCVTNKQWCDFWLYSFQNYMQKYKLKGVFHDMSLPYFEIGTLNGLGYDRNGVRYPEYPVWELRDLYKKTYVLHRKLFPDAMSFMNYGAYIPAIHSFADFLLCAERYETRADRSIYDWDGDGNIAAFRWQCSMPFGPKAMHNGWLKYEYAINEKGPTVHMYGLVLLHDLVQWNITENPEVRKGIHAMKKNFGIGYDREVEFLPYWDHKDKYQVSSKDIVVSLYRSAKNQKLLAILVNTRKEQTFRGTVTLDLKKLEIGKAQKIEIFDPLENTYQPAQNKDSGTTVTIDTEVGPTLFKALLIN